MKQFFLVIVLLLIASSAFAQTAVQVVTQNIPPQGPQTVYTMTLAPTASPCTLILVTRSPLVGFTDSANNTWVQSPNWGLWYTTTCSGAADTLTITFQSPTYFQAVLSAYLGQWAFDQTPINRFTGGFVSGTGAVATSPTISVSSGELVLGFGFNGTIQHPVVTPGAGFWLEGYANEFLEDSIASAGIISSSITYGQSVGWTQGIASFKVLVPPPPPINLTVSGTILFDDGTVVYNGAIIPWQYNGTSWVQAGTINVDASGNLTGTFVVNPNYVDTSGNVQFQLSLPNIIDTGLPVVPLIRFQQGSTGLTINEVLFKTPFMTNLLAVEKASSLVLTP